MQHKFKDVIINQIYNEDIIDFIKLYASSKSKENPLSLIFFGGEPLLYFDIIKKLISKLYGENINYSLITNGSLLNDEIVTFLNNNNISVSISWDGFNTKKSRLIDVFDINKDNIFKLNRFSISCVLNAYNSPKSVLDDFAILDEEYMKHYGVNEHIEFNLDNLYKLDNCNDDVFDIDFNKYNSEILDIVTRYINNPKSCSYPEFVYINSIINNIMEYKEYDETINNKCFSPCMNGIQVLNLDLQGNLYLCHNNIDKKLGTIYSNYDEYIKQYICLNDNPKFYIENCKDCSIRFCCDGGCMLLTEEEKKQYFCKQKRMIYLPIIESLLNYGNAFSNKGGVNEI
jgi:uncharacterized protein